MRTRFRTLKYTLTRCVITSFVCAIFYHGGFGQEQPGRALCSLDLPNGVFAPQTPPTLFGAEFKVPELKFLITKTNEAFAVPKTIRLFYVWEWFEYPSIGYANGVWRENGDIVECSNVTARDVIIPEYKVVPKGWYVGEFANERKNRPRFVHIEVAFETDDCGAPRLLFDRKKIERLKERTISVFLPCGKVPTYQLLRNGR